MGPATIKRALLSVSDKSGIVDFAEKLVEHGVELLSTGGTAKILQESDIPVISIDSYTGHPEIMDGRVKTLHPRVHGGILAMRGNPEHTKQMEENGIAPIDLVVVNLYPFRQTVERSDVTIEEAIENIDIGGPTMIRSAAKNHAYVTVVVDPTDYGTIIEEFSKHDNISLETRTWLAVKAFRHTAAYDTAIDTYLSKVYLDESVIRLSYGRGISLRYGENPHQGAMFYKNGMCFEPCLANAHQIHGKELSYNNIVDGDAALEAVKELGSVPAAAVIKHTNPCGFATGSTLDQALEAAWSGDPISAFGSVIAVSRTVDEKAAKVLAGRFVEMIIAPDFAPEAETFLKEKSSAIRLLAVGEFSGEYSEKRYFKQVVGGLLEQDRDTAVVDKWENVTTSVFPENMKDLGMFAWKACKHVKSNAIVLAQEYGERVFRVVGMGAGQPNRLDSVRKLAVTKTLENFRIEFQNENKTISETDEFSLFGKLVLASDAFFPFPDAVEAAHAAGIQYIVQPGGSKRDNEVIDICNRLGIAMVFTGMRHFRH